LFDKNGKYNPRRNQAFYSEEPKAQALVHRRTNWKASDLGKGNMVTIGADVDLS